MISPSDCPRQRIVRRLSNPRFCEFIVFHCHGCIFFACLQSVNGEALRTTVSCLEADVCWAFRFTVSLVCRGKRLSMDEKTTSLRDMDQMEANVLVVDEPMMQNYEADGKLFYSVGIKPVAN
jgi:hypothetical protein